MLLISSAGPGFSADRTGRRMAVCHTPSPGHTHCGSCSSLLFLLLPIPQTMAGSSVRRRVPDYGWGPVEGGRCGNWAGEGQFVCVCTCVFMSSCVHLFVFWGIQRHLCCASMTTDAGAKSDTEPGWKDIGCSLTHTHTHTHTRTHTHTHTHTLSHSLPLSDPLHVLSTSSERGLSERGGEQADGSRRSEVNIHI